jgi:hypothetical protein
MSHKFKVGEAVNYKPLSHIHREAGGLYSVTALLPENGQPQYRIKHCSENYERLAFEDELSAA